jgi:hypothetical protein
MFFSELTTNDKHKYDVIAEKDGYLACLPIGELKSEVRRNPQAVRINLY